MDQGEGFAGRTGEVYGTKVKIVLTEVVNDQNIKYLNTDDDDEPGVELYVTQAFATGTCLAVSVLDSILSTAYYNHQVQSGCHTHSLSLHTQALTLIKSLISGGMTSELEMILAEGAGLQPGFSSSKILEKRNRARLGQISLHGTEGDSQATRQLFMFRDSTREVGRGEIRRSLHRSLEVPRGALYRTVQIPGPHRQLRCFNCPLRHHQSAWIFRPPPQR